jgi:hypothetical protein
VYYLASVNNAAPKKGEVTAFKKGFRMIVGTSVKCPQFLHESKQTLG